MTLRHRIAHHLMLASLRLTRPPPTIEGIAVMKIWDAIADVRKQIADINSKLADHGQVIATAVDADQFKALSDAVAALPTKDDVSAAVGAGIEAVVGDEPSDVDASVAVVGEQGAELVSSGTATAAN